ncbi:MAG: MBL fold metallo-hydrolase [Rhizobiaceae bacterium]|uniref:MBL fold metallo-hydrolase n=1 Tax=Parvibaculum sp. TaxID=2024848 RepID=UPI001B00823D|nr:MBL fold metallo-hydrolase [Parvibaculum sp.]MBO6633376.1 MBL fold metallo-hydrolase [Parvibaculum sp.]MBO6725845.1 MBL fold metallo-hydrolase [Rhizobiaceae bacterium]
MRIRWVNHASFIVDTGKIKLLTDPWIVGTAFNDGWKLLAPTVATEEDFAEITHIWFSHEHPDHFHPPSIKHFKPMLKPGVEVLFQETKDHRVAAYCKAQGFTVHELADGVPFELDSETTFTVGQVPFYDSWFYLKSGDRSILNLNDCVIENAKDAEKVKALCGHADVLMAQFGYANWEGNPNEVERQKEAAAEKLERIGTFIDVFKPAHIIPFASFIRFSHEENAYLNDHNTGFRETISFIEDHGGAQPVMLKPGDEWDCESPVDNEAAISFYEDAAAAAEKEKLLVSKTVPLAEIEETAHAYRERIRKKNNTYFVRLAELLGFFKTVTFWIKDLETAVSFSHVKGLKMIDGGAHDCDVSLSSDSLAFLFRNEFGFDTLLVNGRFRASEDVEKNLFKTFGIGSLNNAGKSLSFSLVLDLALWWRVFSKAGLDL